MGFSPYIKRTRHDRLKSLRENRIKPRIRPVRSARYERTSNEGHGFSRAVNSEVDEGFRVCVRTQFQVTALMLLYQGTASAVPQWLGLMRALALGLRLS